MPYLYPHPVFILQQYFHAFFYFWFSPVTAISKTSLPSVIAHSMPAGFSPQSLSQALYSVHCSIFFLTLIFSFPKPMYRIFNANIQYDENILIVILWISQSKPCPPHVKTRWALPFSLVNAVLPCWQNSPISPQMSWKTFQVSMYMGLIQSF